MEEPYKEHWDIEIKPQRSLFEVNFKAIWRYRDLLVMFIKRDVVTVYKQTVLGPLWYIAQPLLTTIMFVVIFGRIAGISTDGIPQILFYLSGITIWNYFAETFNNTSKTFIENQDIFGKVFFPRLIVPLSKTIGGLIKFIIQFVLFLLFYLFFILIEGVDISPNSTLLLLPLLILLMAGFGLGTGILFSAITSKYRDLTFLLTFIVQLLMYASSVIVPYSAIPKGLKFYMYWNPFIHIIETFRYMFLGHGYFTWMGLGYSFLVMITVLLTGILVFNKTEKNFIDTV